MTRVPVKPGWVMRLTCSWARVPSSSTLADVNRPQGARSKPSTALCHGFTQWPKTARRALELLAYRADMCSRMAAASGCRCLRPG